MTSITNSQPPLVKRLLFFVKTLKIILKYQSNHIKNLIKLIISPFFIKKLFKYKANQRFITFYYLLLQFTKNIAR